MQVLKALIVDDESPARRELRAQLANFPDVEIVGEATHADEARQLLEAINYDLVFLDIKMPGLSGIELAESLQRWDSAPSIIITTAYQEFALDAFGVGAVDYLVKPFDEERLARALGRLRGVRQRSAVPVEAAREADPAARRVPDRIPVEKGGKTLLVNTGEVSCVFSLNETVYVKVGDQKLLCRFTLRELEQRLSAFGFLRTHRRYLVNLHRVREVIPYFKGSLGLVLNDAERTEVPVSRALARTVKQHLGLLPKN